MGGRGEARVIDRRRLSEPAREMAGVERLRAFRAGAVAMLPPAFPAGFRIGRGRPRA